MGNKSSKVAVKSKDKKSEVAKSGWHPFLNLREEIDHVFDNFQRGWPFGAGARNKELFSLDTPFAFGIQTPAIDVVDKEKALEVKAELPGMDEKDIEVELTDHMLTISGEKKEEHEEGEKEGDYYVSERRYGSFKRSISIPEGVDADKVEAAFNKGVLKVTLPKTPEAQSKARKIEVQAKG